MPRFAKHIFKILFASTLGFALIEVINNPVTAAVDTPTVNSMEGLTKEIYQSMLNRDTVMTYSINGSVSKSKIEKALQDAIAMDPYVQFMVRQYSYQYKSSLLSSSITIYMEYREDADQTAYVTSTVKRVLPTIINKNMNAHEKVKAIHDWVVLNLAYDTSLKNDTAYLGLKEGKTVCQGYALLTYRMLKEAGITNRIAEGKAGGQLHAWNVVNLDGKWYHLDTTWDDPVPDQKGKVSYNYYLRTDKQLRVDHQWTKVYPAAAESYDMTLEWLKKDDQSRTAFYTKLETDLNYIYLKPENIVSSVKTLSAKIEKAVRAGDSSVKVRYTRKATLSDDLSKALQDISGFEGSIRYSYRDFENTGDILLEITLK
ncbi:transglutaminase domain-containing protein [Paenibacillus terrigena]|uniref:transglutaminase domain-containing protein n=1 Tax=Paenibacillus terrigena TaxID=369333 RepID=UPI0028D82453|nr:transglutaminase domain-containing protein [Paenibacillus terrigena]